jgi:hypothetical protein
VSLLPANHDLALHIGATLSLVVTIKDSAGAAVTTSGSAIFQIRSHVDASGTLISASTSGGTIALGGGAGTITVTVPAATTASLSPGRGVYDLVWTKASGAVVRVVQGDVTLSRSVSR